MLLEATALRKTTLALLSLSIILTSLFPSLAGPVYAASVAALTEWTIPTSDSAPTGLALDPAGNCCWFVEYEGNKIGHLDPTANIFQEWALPNSGAFGLGQLGYQPFTSLGIVTLSGSTVVFGAEFSSNKVFLFVPASGIFTEISLPKPDSGPSYVAAEKTGDTAVFWFTEVGIKGTRSSVGAIVYDESNRSSELLEWELPVGPPMGIYAREGSAWIAGPQSIFKLDKSSNQLTMWPIPVHEFATGRFLTADSQGRIWYTSGGGPAHYSTDYYVGVLRPNNTITEWQAEAGSDPAVISINPQTGIPWISEQDSGSIAELNCTSNGTLTQTHPTMTTLAMGIGTTMNTTAGPVSPATNTVLPKVTSIPEHELNEFTVWNLGRATKPHDVVADASGNIWILESGIPVERGLPRGGNKIARLTIQRTAPDFSINAAPSELIINRGSTGKTKITLNSISNFSGAVFLSYSWIGPTPLSIRILPEVGILLSLPPGLSAGAILQVTSASNASIGTFRLRVTGSFGGTFGGASGAVISHFTDVLVTSSPTVETTMTTPTTDIHEGKGIELPVAPIVAFVFVGLVALTLIIRGRRRLKSQPKP